MQKSEIRKDYLLNKYVIITPGRIKRPRDIREQTIITRTADCPFCTENINKKNIVDRIGKSNSYEIISLKNIYPAVTLDNNKAYGTQEVIVETPDHIKELANLPVAQIELLLRMYAKRTAVLSRNKKIDYILCFKNQGSKAGASIVHAHSQIFASQMLPPDIKEEIKLIENYKKQKGSCPYCNIIKKEIKGARRVYEDAQLAVFTPYASQFHYEVWLFTKRHLDNIAKLNDQEFKSFARALKIILLKMQKLNLSFNYFLHQIISSHNQHFYLKIQPRDSIWAGIELGSGLVINSISPEAAAKYYRK